MDVVYTALKCVFSVVFLVVVLVTVEKGGNWIMKPVRALNRSLGGILMDAWMWVVVVALIVLSFWLMGCSNLPPIELCYYVGGQKICVKVGGEVKFDAKLTKEQIEKIRETPEFKEWMKNLKD